MRKVNLVLMVALMTAGCATLDKGLTGNNSMPGEDKRKEEASKLGDVTPEQKDSFVRGEPWVGMSQSQLELLFGGGPKKKQKKLTANGSEEVQLFAVRVGDWKSGIVTKYYKVKMVAGKLAEFQELDENVGSFDKL